MGETSKKQCFVISPIGEEGSSTRKRSDQVFKHIISAALSDLGYEITRADKISEPGIISNQVLHRIMDDELVVADLSEYNPNVFYELAVRHAFQKPCIQIMQKGQRLPFDVAQARTIFFDHQDLDDAASCKANIVDQARALENSEDLGTSPLSVAVDLAAMRRSDDPMRNSIAEVLAEMVVIKSEISAINRSLPLVMTPSDHSRWTNELGDAIANYEGVVEIIRKAQTAFANASGNIKDQPVHLELDNAFADLENSLNSLGAGLGRFASEVRRIKER